MRRRDFLTVCSSLAPLVAGCSDSSSPTDTPPPSTSTPSASATDTATETASPTSTPEPEPPLAEKIVLSQSEDTPGDAFVRGYDLIAKVTGLAWAHGTKTDAELRLKVTTAEGDLEMQSQKLLKITPEEGQEAIIDEALSLNTSSLGGGEYVATATIYDSVMGVGSEPAESAFTVADFNSGQLETAQDNLSEARELIAAAIDRYRSEGPTDSIADVLVVVEEFDGDQIRAPLTPARKRLNTASSQFVDPLHDDILLASRRRKFIRDFTQRHQDLNGLGHQIMSDRTLLEEYKFDTYDHQRQRYEDRLDDIQHTLQDLGSRLENIEPEDSDVEYQARVESFRNTRRLIEDSVLPVLKQMEEAAKTIQAAEDAPTDTKRSVKRLEALQELQSIQSKLEGIGSEDVSLVIEALQETRQTLTDDAEGIES